MQNFKKYNLKFETSRLFLMRLETKHSRIILDYKIKNIKHHRLALPDRQNGYFQESIQKIILKDENEAFNNGTFIRLYIFTKEDSQQKNIVGDINIGDIKLGNISNCVIGIKIDSEHLHKGFAQESLQTVIDYLFVNLNLHSITANILPDNLASQKLFEKLDFEQEGVSRHHMKTGGQWRDHKRYSLINK